MEPDSLSFLTLISNLQSHLVFGSHLTLCKIPAPYLDKPQSPCVFLSWIVKTLTSETRALSACLKFHYLSLR